MLPRFIGRTVDVSTRYRWTVISVALIWGIASALYSVRYFAINTNITDLIAPELSWHQNEKAFKRAFPQRADLILVVVQAPTPENLKQAADALAAQLSERRDVLKSVRRLGGGAFFEKNALLYLPKEDLAKITRGLTEAQPLLNTLAIDPSLRGVLEALSLAILGLQRGQLQLDDFARPLNLASDTLDGVIAGRPDVFSWRVLVKGQPAEPEELRDFLEVHPVLDYNSFEPGKKATDVIRQAAADLKLASEYGASVRLTGPIPLGDDEYATFRQSAPSDILITVLAVLIVLWLALRSARLILACTIGLTVGLAITLALGLMLVGALNLISVAFFVLFIGIGVDFGIQFSVRYRAERHQVDDLRAALQNTGHNIGAQLTLAATAVALGFFSFMPTDYRGLSELGLIAGAGMIVALAISVTLLPALISLFSPPGEPEPLGYRALAPVDRFMERHRIPVVVATLAAALLATPLLYFLQFDFNVLNMRSTTAESVATYFELKRAANAGINSIHVLASSLSEADKQVQRFAQLPEVEKTMTLSSLVPEGQDEKLRLIRKAATTLNPSINPQRSRASPALNRSAPPRLQAPPDDAENIQTLMKTATSLKRAANEGNGPGAVAARRLADLLFRLANDETAVRARAEVAFVRPLNVLLEELRNSLTAQPVTLNTLPPDLKRDWIAEDGRALIEVFPKGDPNDNEVMRKFAAAILAIEPTATGSPVSLQESGRTVVRAFIEAGSWALVSITILLWIVLRRFTDVLMTLVPLVLAGIVTLELCVLIGLPLNFANIIALPLLLGVGVAFKIYYVMAWRAGQTGLLQSSLTHAVFFSAMATATAFGSLSLSSHPGMASMGRLLVHPSGSFDSALGREI